MPRYTGHDGVSGPCSHMAFLHDKRFSWYLQMARRIVFTDSGFWKYAWAHLVMSMTESCRWVSSEGLKTTGNQQRSSALSLTHRDISSLSEYFDDVIHCSTLSQIGEPLLIFTSERLCLSNARYTPSRRQSLFVGRLSFLSVFLCPPAEVGPRLLFWADLTC